jgi:hypothetical protein
MDGYCGQNYKTCDLQKTANVHLTPKGCNFTAAVVVKSVMKVLHGSNAVVA